MSAVKERIKEKQDKKQVGGDVEVIIDEKNVKFYLPNDVREQLRITKIAMSFFSFKDLDFNQQFELEKIYYEFIIKHMLIDGKEIKDINELSFSNMQAYALIYLMELLLPLLSWSDTKAKDSIKLILKGHLKG